MNISPRRSLNQVRFQVRYNALLLREFRAYQLFELTGLNFSSIRSELNRMKKEGFITSRREKTEPGDASERQAGHRGSTVVYHLSEDPRVRCALAKSIEGFAGASILAQPQSRYYYSAQRHIREAIGTSNEDDRERLLAKAQEELLVAIQEEGGELAPESLRSRLNYELAKIAFWQGYGQEMESFFKMLQKTFKDLKDHAMVNNIEGFLLCIRENLYPSNKPPIERAFSLLIAARKNHYWTDDPLTAISLQINHQFLESGDITSPISSISGRTPKPSPPVTRGIIEFANNTASQTGREGLKSSFIHMKILEAATNF